MSSNLTTPSSASDRYQALQSLPLREGLRGKAPYGAPQVRVPYALNVNENSHPLSESVRASILNRVSEQLQNLNRYPDRDAVELRAALAAYVNRARNAGGNTCTGENTRAGERGEAEAAEKGPGFSLDHLWAANGSNEILQQILQAFGGPGRTLLSFAPTYSMYPLLASGTDTGYAAVPRAQDYTLRMDALPEQLREHNPDVIFIASPNNPTGTALPNAEIEQIYALTEGLGSTGAGTMIVVDEAYAEFARDSTATALELLEGRPRLIVSRTMSKAFGLAGARLGYAVADPAVVDALQLVRLPYHLSALTQAAALGALEQVESLLSTVDSIREQRDRMVSSLAALGFEVFASDANFVFFGGVRDSNTLFEALLERGVLIRDVGIPHTLRVSAGTPEETRAFLAAIEALAPVHALSQKAPGPQQNTADRVADPVPTVSEERA